LKVWDPILVQGLKFWVLQDRSTESFVHYPALWLERRDSGFSGATLRAVWCVLLLHPHEPPCPEHFSTTLTVSPGTLRSISALLQPMFWARAWHALCSCIQKWSQISVNGVALDFSSLSHQPGRPSNLAHNAYGRSRVQGLGPLLSCLSRLDAHQIG